jgi:glucosamine 6-phosphate synthetase-like amidotransferase/phosphosugar isomerase protein
MRATRLVQVAKEVASQPRILESFLSERVKRASPGSLLVGAGDSYACSLAAQYVSRGGSLALDPYSLQTAPDFARRREVYFFSVSGRTAANIAAARAVRGVARRTVAVTANLTSPLVGETDDVIAIPYSITPRTPGTLSFSLSLLLATKLSCGPFKCDFGRVFAKASASPNITFSRTGTTYFLGNGPAYAIALYAALKTFEVFGAKASADFLEEFGHASLFSLRRNDEVNIFSAFDPLSNGRKLARALAKGNFHRSLLSAAGRNQYESLFHATFIVQSSVLKEARLKGIASPYLESEAGKLKMSDSIIY